MDQWLQCSVPGCWYDSQLQCLHAYKTLIVLRLRWTLKNSKQFQLICTAALTTVSLIAPLLLWNVYPMDKSFTAISTPWDSKKGPSPGFSISNRQAQHILRTLMIVSAKYILQRCVPPKTPEISNEMLLILLLEKALLPARELR